MKNILKLLFTICAFSVLTFSYANAASDEPETAAVGQQDDESVDCIAINGGSGNAESGQGTAEESGPTGNGNDR